MPTVADIISWNWWLILACLIAAAEIFMPGVYLIWVACALALTGLVHFLYPLPLGQELVVAACFMPITLYVGHRAYRQSLAPPEGQPLHARAERHVGEEITLDQPMRESGGKIALGGTLWKAQGADAEKGDKVKIIAYQNGVFQLRRL